jgi:acyl-CoA thioester hydrolase
MGWPVLYERKVRFSDTDAQGVVFNGMYATYFDDTITDYFDAIGVPWSELNASGHDMVLARIEIDFRSSGRFGEVLVTGARVKRIGNSSLVFELRTWEESSGRTVAEAVQVQVIVDHATFKPVPVPSFLSDAVVRSQEPPPEQEG